MWSAGAQSRFASTPEMAPSPASSFGELNPARLGWTSATPKIRNNRKNFV
jgi:hypothetical protein